MGGTQQVSRTTPNCLAFSMENGLETCDELDTLKHMMSQCGKLLNTTLDKDTASRARVNNEKQQMADTLLLALWTLPPMAQMVKKDCLFHRRGGDFSFLVSHTQQA